MTLLFTDIVGSTLLIERLGDKRWLELLQVGYRALFVLDGRNAAGGTGAEDGDGARHQARLGDGSGHDFGNVVGIGVAEGLQRNLASDDHAYDLSHCQHSSAARSVNVKLGCAIRPR